MNRLSKIRNMLGKAWFTFFAVLFILGSIYTVLHLTYDYWYWICPNSICPKQGDLSFEQEKEELTKERPSPGHMLISSRSLVDGYGSLAEGRDKDHWSAVGTQEQVFSQITDKTRFVVIFVHGYNTPVTKAVERGERLRSIVCEEDAQACPRARLYSFLWRGDLNPAQFRAAQDSATASAHPFAAFVRRVRHREPELPILVVSHSLGARVVLEGLRLLGQSEKRQWVSLVLLIQPAVRVSSVSRWKEACWVFFKCWEEGTYWDGLGSAGLIFATVSAGDRTLKNLFEPGQKVSTDPFSKALGFATDLANWTDDQHISARSAYFYTDRESPVQTIDIYPLDHSDIFELGRLPEEKLSSLWIRARKELNAIQNRNPKGIP